MLPKWLWFSLKTFIMTRNRLDIMFRLLHISYLLPFPFIVKSYFMMNIKYWLGEGILSKRVIVYLLTFLWAFALTHLLFCFFFLFFIFGPITHQLSAYWFFFFCSSKNDQKPKTQKNYVREITWKRKTKNRMSKQKQMQWATLNVS